jgi:hypothetical protein
MQAIRASMEFCLDESRCQTVMRCELKRTDRPTPQIWSAIFEDKVSFYGQIL